MPVIKPSGIVNSQKNFFYLFGEKETGLTKAFAYILGENPTLLFTFLKELGIPIRQSKSNYREIEISTESSSEEGRTDIEIKLAGYLHVIIEAKVKNNKIDKQNTQYLSKFNNEPDTPSHRVMCFISQIHEHKKKQTSNIVTKNISWIYIDRLIDEPLFLSDPIIRDFQLYLRRYFITMKAQKEILIQDLSNAQEIQNYRDFNIYRRNVVFGSPLYFSPYFSRSSEQPEGEGASFISKVLGIISCKPAEIGSFEEELKSFCMEKDEPEQQQLIKKWKSGLEKYTEDKEYTFFFLDNPIKLPGKALKDSSSRNEKGRGKGWIASMISPNRCITFADLLSHLQ